MNRIDIKKAATFARQSYKPHKNPSFTVKSTFNEEGVQAVMTTDNILLLPGSNGVWDYLKFNLRVFNVGGQKFGMKSDETAKGDSKTMWHQGFLKYARIAYGWAKNDKPDLIIGHSLGAAAAQILGPSFGVPAICFASPRPLKGTLKSPLANHAGKCLSICRTDDTVCGMPPGFQHIGDVRFLTPKRFSWGFDHSMKQYQKVLDKNKGPDTVPAKWK